MAECQPATNITAEGHKWSKLCTNCFLQGNKEERDLSDCCKTPLYWGYTVGEDGCTCKSREVVHTTQCSLVCKQWGFSKVQVAELEEIRKNWPSVEAQEKLKLFKEEAVGKDTSKSK